MTPLRGACATLGAVVSSEGVSRAAKRAWPEGGRRRRAIALVACALLAAAAIALPAGTQADQASQPTSPAAGWIDASGGAGDSSGHTCARLDGGEVRCWGFGGSGRLGYGNSQTIGDDETPGAVGPVDLGEGRSAVAISAGAFHSCALLDNANVRCWGFGGDGRLGYGNTTTIGDDETPGAAGPVALGAGRTAVAVSAGGAHTCALLDDGSVRCWGFGGGGRLGYGIDDPEGEAEDIGDDEQPGSVDPIDLGGDPGDKRTAVAISAGQSHTCAVLDNLSVRCWGFGDNGQLGYGNTDTIGDNEKPGSVGPVDLGAGRTAKAISAGDGHTCAVLDNDSVRCWGFGGNGRLGYGNRNTIGDNEKPGSVGPVDLGGEPGDQRTAQAIGAGDNHTCALLDDDTVRCWGFARNGRVGYGNIEDVGDDEEPGSVGPVDLGEGRTAKAIGVGGRHTCALLDDDSIRCWGEAAQGRLGYCNAEDIGDDETPGSVGPVNVLEAGDCPVPPVPEPPPASGGEPVAPGGEGDGPAASAPAPEETGASRAELRLRALRTARAAQARRGRKLRGCLRGAARRRASERRRAARRRCRSRYGRTPGRIRGLRARRASKTKVVLSFRAAGTQGSRLPAARSYVVKQSRRPIRRKRGFRRANTLCRGRCRFKVGFVGARIKLVVTDLRPGTTYYYAVAARDNVSGRRGRRSRTVKARTRG